MLQILIAGWLWWARTRTPLVLALLVVQITGGIIALTSLIDLDAAMLYGQLVFQVAFTTCLAVAVAGVAARSQGSVAGSPLARPHRLRSR